MEAAKETKTETVLVTGGAGFIGSNFIPFFLDTYPGKRVINLDKLTYAGDINNLREISDHPDYEFVHGDISIRELVDFLFSKYDIRGVFHFAAESHVDNSIRDPEVFIRTNVLGTFTLLNAARQHWMEAPHVVRAGYEGCRFHHVSTDEVYGSLGETGFFTEQTPYDPSSPYSSSKAGSDLIVRSFFRTYGLNAVITNCANNFGPRQHDEKLIPTVIRKALALEKIPIYGDGRNRRDWLFVRDHCQGITTVYNQGQAGETYNIGADNERENLTLVNLICDVLDEVAGEVLRSSTHRSFRELMTFVPDRPGHDRRYALDTTKIKTELGWQPETGFAEALRTTVSWYVKKYKR